jgi:S-adenosylmethionine decarboxylase
MVDALDCEESALRDLERLQQICERVIADLGLNVVGTPQAHQFPGPGGVTALYMLSESHLACHTYPEHRMATFNLYCCRQRPAWPWSLELATWLGAGEVMVRQFARGREATGGQHPIDFLSSEANG